MGFSGTLHIGNLCNNNYKLFMALRKVGVDAHFVNIIRINRYNSVPEDYDRAFNPAAPFVHTIGIKFENKTLQKLYELVQIRNLLKRFGHTYWVHAQSDFPLYIQWFCEQYSSHSTGSDIRKDFFRRDLNGRFLRRGYRRSKIVFYNNIDLHDHVLKKEVPFFFLPNAVDLSKFAPRESAEKEKTHLDILFASRLTYFAEEDIKGHGRLFAALQRLKGEDFRANIILPTEEPNGKRFADLCRDLAPQITFQFRSFRYDKLLYLREIQKADFIIDQFSMGLMGGTALDCFAMKKVALVHLDPIAFARCYGDTPLLPPLDSEERIAAMLLKLRNREYRRQLEGDLFNWLCRFHEDREVALYFLERLEKVGIDIERTIPAIRGEHAQPDALQLAR